MKVIELSPHSFEEYARSHEFSNPWQSAPYGNIMSKFGFDIKYVGFEHENRLVGASLLLGKTVYMGFKHYYAPRGLLVDYDDRLTLESILKEFRKYILKQKGLVYTIDPFVVKSIRTKKGLVLKERSNYEDIINTFKKSGVEYRGLNLYFEGIQPRWYASISLPVNPQKVFSKISKPTRNKLRKSAKFGIEIFQDETSNIDTLYEVIKNNTKRSVEYYRELKNQFGDACEIYYARINTERYVQNSKMLFERETEKSDLLNSIIQTDSYKGKNMRAILNKKMESDKVISSYKTHLINSTQLLKDYPEGLIIAACIVIKYRSIIYIYEESFNRQYGNLCPLHLLRWKIIEKYSSIDGVLNLNAVTGEFDSKKNSYRGLNEIRLSYGGEITEYIGELSCIVNKPLFSLYANNRKPFEI